MIEKLEEKVAQLLMRIKQLRFMIKQPMNCLANLLN